MNCSVTGIQAIGNSFKTTMSRRKKNYQHLVADRISAHANWPTCMFSDVQKPVMSHIQTSTC